MPAKGRRNKEPSMQTENFRAIVRGTTPDGRRVRRVRNLAAPSYEAAWLSFESVYVDMAAGLSDVFANVYPPVGIRLDGTASVGFELATA